MTPEEIAARIRQVLPDAEIELTGADCHFEVSVVSQRLGSYSQLARQRMLLTLFNQELASGVLHALSIRANTPHEAATSQATRSAT